MFGYAPWMMPPPAPVPPDYLGMLYAQNAQRAAAMQNYYSGGLHPDMFMDAGAYERDRIARYTLANGIASGELPDLPAWSAAIAGYRGIIP